VKEAVLLVPAFKQNVQVVFCTELRRGALLIVSAPNWHRSLRADGKSFELDCRRIGLPRLGCLQAAFKRFKLYSPTTKQEMKAFCLELRWGAPHLNLWAAEKSFQLDRQKSGLPGVGGLETAL